MTVKYVDTYDLSGKYAANLLELKRSDMRYQYCIRKERGSKQTGIIIIIITGVVRACAFKQATQTQDGSQSFHNLSTKVSSLTYVYVQRQ